MGALALGSKTTMSKAWKQYTTLARLFRYVAMLQGCNTFATLFATLIYIYINTLHLYIYMLHDLCIQYGYENSISIYLFLYKNVSEIISSTPPIYFRKTATLQPP
jgi:hypothetical protein